MTTTKTLQILSALLLAAWLGIPAMQAQTTAAEVEAALAQNRSLRANSPLAMYPFRNVGPVVQGGRITDLDVDPRDPHTFYVAYASGGLFVTHNNGQTFAPIFDNQGAIGIGDIAISPANPDLIWVGTGESNSSRSSYAGAGIFKTTDAGKNWQHLGLTGTQHIGRVIAHPTDPQVAWVGAMGALYTENEDRGVYKTTDGGTTWTQTLYLDPSTGIIDLIIDPKNPDRLWAAAWDRSRKAWEFVEGGSGSAIYFSEDGGANWSKSMSGIPTGENTGRLGLAISPSNPEVLYAFLDNQEQDPSLVKEDTVAGIALRMLGEISLDDFMLLENTRLDSFLRSAGYPEKYTAEGIKRDIEAGKYPLKAVAEYFGDANEALFNTAVKGAEVYRSDNGGQSWRRTHDEVLQGVYFTYGYYFGNVRVAPDNPDELFLAGYPLLRSADGGANWTRLDTFEIHVDHHALWINPADADHLILGNDGGLYISYDRGANWTHVNNLPVGQFYTVHVDMAQPYNVYGGLQDNGVLKGSSRSVPNRTRKWERVFGGDGMFIVTDHKNPGLLYTGYQFGNYFRIAPGQPPKYITPRHDIGEDKYRWNWRTPLRQSPHNHEILYFGSQYLMRSLDMGDTWEAISPDLTTNRQPQGNVPFSTLTTISESPKKFGLIWVGSDDGRVHVTTDGGNSWTERIAGLPEGKWVSKVFASPHDPATAFVSLTGYRDDDFSPYVYKTSDYGATWTSLVGNLPQEPVNVIIQDPVSPDLLYLGTDHGTYASLNGGQVWDMFCALPDVAAYDMVVHPRDNELVVGTHGRSIYIADVKPLQALKDTEENQALVAYAPAEVRHRSNWGEKNFPYNPVNETEVQLDFYLREAAEPGRQVTVSVRDTAGTTHYESKLVARRGFNRVPWNLKLAQKGTSRYLPPGEYDLVYKLGFEEQTTKLKIVQK
ncbi:MAG: glycosyl hydrolase [Bacteroidota bacterium]